MSGPYCTNCGYLRSENDCRCQTNNGGDHCEWCSHSPCRCPNKQYDADYFLRGKETGKSLYENYRWLPDLTTPMVCSIISHLGIRSGDTILDFGCAALNVVYENQELCTIGTI